MHPAGTVRTWMCTWRCPMRSGTHRTDPHVTSTALNKDPQPDLTPEPDAAAAASARAPAWLDAARGFLAGRWLPRLVALLAVVPPVLTLSDVANSGRLQHLDYLFH